LTRTTLSTDENQDGLDEIFWMNPSPSPDQHSTGHHWMGESPSGLDEKVWMNPNLVQTQALLN
jgi:hypothetical protein